MTERELFIRLEERFSALEKLLNEKMDHLAKQLADFRPAECASRGVRLDHLEKLVYGSVGVAMTSMFTALGTVIWNMWQRLPK